MTATPLELDRDGTRLAVRDFGIHLDRPAAWNAALAGFLSGAG